MLGNYVCQQRCCILVYPLVRNICSISHFYTKNIRGQYHCNIIRGQYHCNIIRGQYHCSVMLSYTTFTRHRSLQTTNVYIRGFTYFASAVVPSGQKSGHCYNKMNTYMSRDIYTWNHFISWLVYIIVYLVQGKNE